MTLKPRNTHSMMGEHYAKEFVSESKCNKINVVSDCKIPQWCKLSRKLLNKDVIGDVENNYDWGYSFIQSDRTKTGAMEVK